ncbi:MAG: trypsin-like peptidase domain-containing protein [Nitrososphaerota archaeon]
MYLDENKIVEIVEKTNPSVVNVSTVHLLNVFPFYSVPIKGVGSGVIIDSDGYIVTNNHVVEGAEAVEVSLNDGRVFKGRIIGRDPGSDLAIIKIDAKNLKAAELGDSSNLKAGQFIIAIGNPFGLRGGPTVTIGVISAINRSINTEKGIMEDLIQTDAAINPGNSGGPLIDLNGKVIALATAIIPFAQGIGFAIPINKVKKIAEDLIKYGKVIRPWLGIYGVDLTPQLSSYYNLPVQEGVIIAKVIRGSPADISGIEEGDIILSVDRMPIKNMMELQKIIQNKKVGEEVTIRIIRDYKTYDVKVELSKSP